MDKGSPDNPRISPDNPSRLEAASKWTRVRRTTSGVRRTTLHDLRRPPNGQGFAGQPRGSPDNPSRLEAASKWTRVRRTTPGVRRTTLRDLRRPPNWTRVCRTTLHDLRRPPNTHGFDKGSPDNPSRLEAGRTDWCFRSQRSENQ